MKITREIKIAIIGLICIVLIIWGMNFLKGKNILKKTTRYYAVYERIENLQVSAPVMIKGFKAGQVGKLYFDNNSRGNIIAVLSVQEEFVIPVNSVARLFSSDLMGTKAIEINISDSTRIYEEGDTIPTEIEADLAEQVSIQMLPLKNKAEDLIKDIQEALEVIKYVFNESTQENLTRSFASIKRTIQSLEQTSYNIDTMIISERSKFKNIFSNIEDITGNLKENNDYFNHIIQNFSTISDSLAKSTIASTIINTNKTVVELNEILAKINNAEGTMGLLLNDDSLYFELDRVSKDLDALINDVKKNPKKYVHFSVIDLGKTVYISDDKKITEKNKK
ncbi:MlaD family protein [Bacteroidota bacterium]